MLDPSKVPRDCSSCGKCELDPNNYEIWNLYSRFPSLVSIEHGVAHANALKVFSSVGYSEEDWVGLEKLESMRAGFLERIRG